MCCRTRMILLKIINRDIVSEINGCVSAGKEANVYHARTNDGQHRAIKIYKTSILVFKDRARYVTGEFRWRRGYCKRSVQSFASRQHADNASIPVLWLIFSWPTFDHECVFQQSAEDGRDLGRKGNAKLEAASQFRCPLPGTLFPPASCSGDVVHRR